MLSFSLPISRRRRRRRRRLVGARGRWRICSASPRPDARSLPPSQLPFSFSSSFSRLLHRAAAQLRLPHRAARPRAPTAARPPAPRSDNINEGGGAGPLRLGGPSLNLTDRSSRPTSGDFPRPGGPSCRLSG